jgi:hypothetical protein
MLRRSPQIGEYKYFKLILLLAVAIPNDFFIFVGVKNILLATNLTVPGYPKALQEWVFYSIGQNFLIFWGNFTKLLRILIILHNSQEQIFKPI